MCIHLHFICHYIEVLNHKIGQPYEDHNKVICAIGKIIV